MQRHSLRPRPNWQEIVTTQGLTFHSPSDETDARPYWDENACYEFTSSEVDRLEAAGNELQVMCLAAAQRVIDQKRYAELEIPEEAIASIEWAWEQEPPAIYGRFDILWNGEGSPKLLEYNADTPTSLLEAAVTQWNWLRDVLPSADQFNSIHQRLVAKWKDVQSYLSEPVYFASADNAEDRLTTAYLRDTAQQAGLETEQLLMEEIGWNERRGCFVDSAPQEHAIGSIFKLYPWETMLEEQFAPQALQTYRNMQWIEPIWKMLLSNKGILSILWELYPGHELLLEAHPASRNHTPAPGWIRKPMHSREGANVTIARPDGSLTRTDGPYTNRMCVDQRLGQATHFMDASGGSRWPVLGIWMIDQECCGMGIREDAGPITGNLSSFVPHYFR